MKRRKGDSLLGECTSATGADRSFVCSTEAAHIMF